MSWLMVVLGAMMGAPARYLTDRYVQARHDTMFPWGTFVVNVVASLALGVVVGAAAAAVASADVLLLLGTGLCGALSTYSTFSYETLRLTETGMRLYAVTYVVASVLAAVGAAVVGVAIAQAAWT